MGAFKLIEQKEYKKFCELYLDKSHLRKSQSEYVDLIPGNYIIALIGARQYETLISFCLSMNEEVQKSSQKIDRSSSMYYIALSIGYFELQKYENAIQALLDGSHAAYQDIPRTRVPSLLYYEAIMLNDKKAKQESKKLLNARLRKQTALSSEYAVAGFLVGKCNSESMLSQIELCPPILRERAKVQAYFYMAIKAFEKGDLDEYAKYLKDACNLYRSVPTVTLEFEYHLAEICYSKI